MNVSEADIEKLAIEQAEYDKRPWYSMPKVDRQRYIERVIILLKAIKDKNL